MLLYKAKKGDSMENLNNLIELNNSILKIYKTIADYDILGFANPNIFEILINRIKELREEEEKYIGTINPNALIDSQEKLIQKITGDEDADFLDDVLVGNYAYLPGKRAINQIYYYGLEHNYCEVAYAENVTEEELDDLMGQKDAYEHGLSIELIREKVITHTLLDYIKEALENEKDEKIREKLIKAKYYIIYLRPCVEEDFLANPKSFSKRVHYMDKLLTSKMSPIEIEEYCQYVAGIILGEVNDFEALPDEYFENVDNQANAYLKTFYLKTIYSINISKNIGRVLNDARIELEKRDKKSSEYIKAGLDKNLSYRMCKNID